MTDRAGWHAVTQQYFQKRPTLIEILLLVDASIAPRQEDIQGVSWLHKRKLPHTLVFTKVDKGQGGSMTGPADHINMFREALLQERLPIPPHFATSAVTGLGRRGLLTYIHQLLDQQQPQQHELLW